VSKGESPQSQVRSGVRNSSKNEFDGFNELMDKDFSESVMFSSRTFLLDELSNLFVGLILNESFSFWILLILN